MAEPKANPFTNGYACIARQPSHSPVAPCRLFAFLVIEDYKSLSQCLSEEIPIIITIGILR